MIIHSHELEIYQQCPARWKLKNRFPPALDTPSDYTQALRRTIHYMYSWQMSNSKLIREKSVQNFWDQQWWYKGWQDKPTDKKRLFEKASEGWLLLEKFYHRFYTELEPIPVGINFDINWKNNLIDYKTHFDLILADSDGIITYIELGGRRNEWQIYTSLATKLEICSILETTGKPPAKKIHIDLVSKKGDFTRRVLNITDTYVQESLEIISSVSRNIESDTLYCSWSESCKQCPCSTECWF